MRRSSTLGLLVLCLAVDIAWAGPDDVAPGPGDGGGRWPGSTILMRNATAGCSLDVRVFSREAVGDIELVVEYDSTRTAILFASARGVCADWTLYVEDDARDIAPTLPGMNAARWFRLWGDGDWFRDTSGTGAKVLSLWIVEHENAGPIALNMRCAATRLAGASGYVFCGPDLDWWRGGDLLKVSTAAACSCGSFVWHGRY